MTDRETVYENESGEVGRYGNLFYNVYLTNGELVQFHTDRLEVTPNGDLLSFSDTSLPETSQGVPYPPLVGWAAGVWERFEGASLFTGDPVAIDHVAMPVAGRSESDDA